MKYILTILLIFLISLIFSKATYASLQYSHGSSSVTVSYASVSDITSTCSNANYWVVNIGYDDLHTQYHSSAHAISETTITSTFNIPNGTSIQLIEAWMGATEEEALVGNCVVEVAYKLSGLFTWNAAQISNVSASEVSNNSAKINWTTNVATTGSVEYGTSTSYGSSKNDLTSTTSHNLTIENLTANTTYHFRITATDSTGNSQTGDYTFATAKNTTTSTQLVTPTPTPTPLPDSTKPIVTVLTDFKKPFTTAPKITGKATDNKDLSKIEYSTDGGQNWVQLDKAIKPNTTFTNFEFTPQISEDGNYSLNVRAYDSNNNIGYSRKSTIILDRLSPQISGVQFSLGPQIINPRSDGSILITQKQPLKIALSEVGGSTKVEIIAQNKTNKKTKTYTLTKNPEIFLWSDILLFEEKGEYKLKFKAVDGALNNTETESSNVIVVDSGKISSKAQDPIQAKITVYQQEATSNSWQLWDGEAYSQSNPQKTDKNGAYSLFLPSGKYYLKIESYGHRTLETIFFTVDKPQLINANFVLIPSKLLFSLGFIKIYYPDFSKQITSFKNNIPEVLENKNSLIGKSAPFFRLDAQQGHFESTSLRGKESVLTFLNTWSPSSLEQVGILDQFSKKNNFNNATILLGEKKTKAHIFKNRGGYNLKIIADPDATLVLPYKLNELPVHFFMDRKGTIREVVSGVLSVEEMENILLGIEQ